MNKMNFTVDKEKCIKCGLCIKDCMVSALAADENNMPIVAPRGEKRCFRCQHCLAICPVGAISIFDKNPEDSDSLNNYPEPEKLLNLIQGRRSFRQYKKENTPPEKIEKLKNMLSYTPTGVNFRGLHFTFVEDISAMDKIRESVREKLTTIFKYLPKVFWGRYANYIKAFLSGKDIIFRGAPNMVVVSVQKDSPCADIDPVIALSYFELYAQSLGLGTCWCGIAKSAFQIPALAKELKIPKDSKLSYVMLFGPSKVKYARTIQPEKYTEITFN